MRLPLSSKEFERMPEPHNNPVMNGGLFRIRREYFRHLDDCNKRLEICGEQFELSYKIWLCGARLLEVPCSRVAVIKFPETLAPDLLRTCLPVTQLIMLRVRHKV
uniref:Uncharacterized protein n=1 Tax=Glossina palpalis gambiensis TaxID=67801 RepID=A0A1B0BTG0_9MUSC